VYVQPPQRIRFALAFPLKNLFALYTQAKYISLTTPY